MADQDQNINLNVRASGPNTVKQDLKGIADGIREVANASKLSSDTLHQIQQAIQSTSGSSNELKSAISGVTEQLIGLRAGVDAIAEAQAESVELKKRLAEAAAEAKKLREEIQEQKKAIQAIKDSQDAINQAFTNPLRFATQQALEFSRGMGMVAGVAAALAIGLTGTAVAAAALVKHFGEDTREAENLANRLGLTTAQAMKLRAEAEILGVNIHTVEFAARQLASALEDPTGSGKKAADALARINISTYDLTGNARELGPVFLQVLDHLSQIHSTSERVREAQILLGRSAKELEPLIVNYDQLKRSVDDMRLHMDQATTKELLAANKSINEMTQALKDLGRAAAAKIAPIVISITRVIKDVTSNNSSTMTGFAGAGGVGGLLYGGEGGKETVNDQQRAALAQLPLQSGLMSGQLTSAMAGVNAAVETGKKVAKQTIEAYSHTADGLRDELHALKSEEAKVLAELNAAATGQGAELSAGANSKRLTEIQRREAEIQGLLKVKTHDKTKEELIAIDHERARISLEVEEETWRKTKEFDVQGVEERRANLIRVNDLIAQDKRKELEEERDSLDQSQQGYKARYERYNLEIAKLDAETARKRVDVNEQAENEIDAIVERELKKVEQRADREKKLWERQLEEVARMDEQRQAKFDRADEITEQSKRRHIDHLTRMDEETINFMAEIGVISEKTRTAKLLALYKEQEDQDKAHIQRMIEIEMNDPKADPERLARLRSQLAAIEDKGRERSQAAEQKEVLDRVNNWNRGINIMGNAFDKGIRGMVEQGKSFGQVWRGTLSDMVSGFEQALVKMGIKWVQHQIAKLILHQATNAGIVTSDAAASAQSNAIGIRQHLKDVLRAAKSGAAKAYNALAGVPIIGPTVLGPAAAVATFAGIMAFGAISAQRGAVLPNENTMGFLHPREMVLPAHLSEGLQNMISGGGPQGGNQFAFAPVVQAFDSRGVDRVLEQHGKKFMKLFDSQLRYGYA